MAYNHGVKWAHHPPEIKHLIHKGGFVPKMKSCFENCSKLMLSSHFNSDWDARLRYCEGWIRCADALPIEMAHAWIMFDDKRIDLTLSPERPIEYLDPYVVLTVPEVKKGIQDTKTYGPFTNLDDIHPMKEIYARVRWLAEHGSEAIGVVE